MTLGGGAGVCLARVVAVVAFRAVAFFATFVLDEVALRGGLVIGFFPAFALLAERPATFRAFFAGAFAAGLAFAKAFSLADLGFLVASFDGERLDAPRLIPFVTGLLIGTP